MQIPEAVMLVCSTLRDAGFEAWLVGGAVRDAIMGRDAHDWDIATNALPTQVIPLFPRVIETGIQHGTVTVLVDGTGYEVTTFRGEGAYSDGRRPDSVRFLGSIKEDLARRDFTVNAIAYDPLRGVFADPYGGRQDIERRVLRAVGDPGQRFAEDGLRVLRAARFAATLGFDLDPETKAAIQPSLATYTKVAVERVQAEWLKCMQAKEPSRAFRIMAETGILGVTVPEFLPMLGCSQNRYHAFDVWEHTLHVMDACPVGDPILRMAALFHDVGKPASKAIHPVTGDGTFYDHEVIGAELAHNILNRMKFSSADRDRVVHLVRHHFIRYESHWSNATIRRWVRRVGLGHVASLCVLARADIAGKGPAMMELEPKVINELESRIADLQVTEVMPTSAKALAINGRDLMSHLGISSGPQVGRVLSALLEAVTDDPELNTRDRLLDLATQVA